MRAAAALQRIWRGAEAFRATYPDHYGGNPKRPSKKKRHQSGTATPQASQAVDDQHHDAGNATDSDSLQLVGGVIEGMLSVSSGEDSQFERLSERNGTPIWE